MLATFSPKQTFSQRQLFSSRLQIDPFNLAKMLTKLDFRGQINVKLLMYFPASRVSFSVILRQEEKETLLWLKMMFDVTAIHDRGWNKPFYFLTSCRKVFSTHA